jgi:hypothetical protein
MKNEEEARIAELRRVKVSGASPGTRRTEPLI